MAVRSDQNDIGWSSLRGLLDPIISFRKAIAQMAVKSENLPRMVTAQMAVRSVNLLRMVIAQMAEKSDNLLRMVIAQMADRSDQSWSDGHRFRLLLDPIKNYAGWSTHQLAGWSDHSPDGQRIS